MKALIDTNIILDAIAAREPFRESAERIFLLVAEEKIEGCITANSLTDIFYIIRKSLSDTLAREALRRLMQVFSVVDLSSGDCETALELPISDFEDAVVMVCGQKAGAEYIVSRDADFLKTESTIPVISPADFLEQFAG